MDYFSNIKLKKKKETANFKLNFYSLVDKIISSILPIQYEFPLETIETNIKEEEEYQDFIYSIFIPKLEQFLNENHSYYKIVAIEQKLKYDKKFKNENIDIYKIKNLYSDKSVIIKLNEKAFHEIRNDILNMIFISFINKSNDKNYVSNFLNDVDSINLLSLKNLISYKKINVDKNKLCFYEYKFFISFEDYLKIRNNIDLYIQFKFWLNFFMKKLLFRISEIEYEYYTNFTKDETDNEIFEKFEDYEEVKVNISYKFMAYLDFISNFINYSLDSNGLQKFVKPKINLYLIDNINCIDYLIGKVGKDIINLEEFQNNDIKKEINIKFEKLIFNNICIKLYGKYSGYNFNNFFENMSNNKIENIIINITNFNDYEYLEIIQNDDDIINEIRKTANKIFSSLSKFLIKIKKNKLKSIILYIKGFNNNILLNEIKEKFNEFMKELIKQNSIIKNIRIYFSNIFSEDKEKKSNSKINSDSIYSFPCLEEKEYSKFNLNNKKKKFKLLLFDNNINIRDNKIIDFYFFENFSIKRIEDLSLGYFNNILELNKFLKKIKLYELCNMKKFSCFLKNNYKIKEKSLTTFFKLDWPKNTLTSFKIIFENFAKNIDEDNNNNNSNSKYKKYLVEMDMHKIFDSIIKEFYFQRESQDDIKKIILVKHPDDFEGTMIQDIKNNDSFDTKLKIVKTKNFEDKNIISTSTKKPEQNNTSLFMQQSNNMFIQSKESSLNLIFKNPNKKNSFYINDTKSVEEYHNNNFYKLTNSNQYQKYPLKYFYIMKSETYLKYFLNNNKKELFKNTYLFNETFGFNNIGKKAEEKYKIYLNFKKSLVIINKNINNIFSLIYALIKTKNKNFLKLINTNLRYKIIHYQYYQRNPVLLDYIISFLNDPIFIYNDFKHSSKLFKKVIEE